MEPLDPKLRRLLDQALPAAAPDVDAQARGLESLVAQLDPDSPIPDAPPATAAPATAGLTKLVLVVAVAGAVGTAGWLAVRPDPPPRSTTAGPRTASPSKPAAAPTDPVGPTFAPEPPPAIEVADTPPPSPALSPGRAPKSSRKRPPTSEPPRSVADALRAEAELIARAESALDRNKPREALALCDMHRTGFDAPQLSSERQAISASAACMLDTRDTGAARAFVRVHPRGALAKKVRQRCKLKTAETTPTEP